MRAMILAAGRGERMRPLTDSLPKPMLAVGGKPLIVWHIQALVRAGIGDIVINHAWLGQKIEQALGDGSQFGANISYSPEPRPLETAGGIAQTLAFFQDEPFLVVNGDIWCDWDRQHAIAHANTMAQTGLSAWLLLVSNPDHHPDGDFVLDTHGKVGNKPTNPTTDTLTFSGIGIYQPQLFESIVPGQPAALGPLLRQAALSGHVGGTRHQGQWTDVGTPERLHQLNQSIGPENGLGTPKDGTLH